MLFSPKNLLVGAACALFVSSVSADCISGPWKPEHYHYYGDVTGGGTEFCESKWENGIVMNGIEVWADKKGVLATKFYYSDDSTSPIYGRIDGDIYQRFDWDPSTERIETMRMWGNGQGRRLGRIQIRTEGGKELDAGKDTSGQDTFEIDVGSGIMLGAIGSSNDYFINKMGFLFLRSKIDTIRLEDVAFAETPEELNKRQEGLETVILDYADHINNHPTANETFKFAKTVTRSNEKKFSTTATHAFGFSQAFEISGKILNLGASSTTTLKYDYSHAATEESSQKTEVALNYEVITWLQPGQRVFCQAIAMYGKYDGKYYANVKVYLEDGSEFTFAQGGTMEQVAYSTASSACQEEPFTTVNAGKRAVKFIA